MVLSSHRIPQLTEYRNSQNAATRRSPRLIEYRTSQNAATRRSLRLIEYRTSKNAASCRISCLTAASDRNPGLCMAKVLTNVGLLSNASVKKMNQFTLFMNQLTHFMNQFSLFMNLCPDCSGECRENVGSCVSISYGVFIPMHPPFLLRRVCPG